MDNKDQCVYLFPDSILAPRGWSDFGIFADDFLWFTRRALQVLAALLYGANLDLHQLRFGRTLDVLAIDREMFALVVTMCAIAEFWGCLEVIKPRMLSILKQCPIYWEGVAWDPKRHMTLALKLEDAEIYRDALRHMIAKAHLNQFNLWNQDWSDVVEVTGWTETELRKFYTGQLESVELIARTLREDLQRLHLWSVFANHQKFFSDDTHTRFLDTIPLDDPERKPSRVPLLGGAIYSEWLTYQISGKKVEQGPELVKVEAAG